MSAPPHPSIQALRDFLNAVQEDLNGIILAAMAREIERRRDLRDRPPPAGWDDLENMR